MVKHSLIKKEQKVSKLVSRRRVGCLLAFRYVVLAFERYISYRRSQALAAKGFIVVGDRYPSVEFGKMDGPRIPDCDDYPFLMRTLQNVEK